MNEEVIEELIQDEFNLKNLVNRLDLILNNDAYRSRIKNKYKILLGKLGEKGASKRAASSIFNYLK